MTHNILRLPATNNKTGISRSGIYDRLNPRSPRYDPTFPKPIKLGARAIGFFESELDSWLASRASSRVAKVEGAA